MLEDSNSGIKKKSGIVKKELWGRQLPSGRNFRMSHASAIEP